MMRYAVCVLNHELKVSNELMKRNNICEFQAHSVTGADSQEHLCQYIETDGWMPCNASVHISNIEGLINNLGGEKLYGSEHKLEIVLRELIQNNLSSSFRWQESWLQFVFVQRQ